MRINAYLAQATGLSRRKADIAISEGRVTVNEQLATPGQQISPSDTVTLDNLPITPAVKVQTIVLNKPVDYVCSRNGQGSKTIYNLLPAELYQLKPVGRLDKDSSGLLLLTNDGALAHQLTHPSFQKEKVYEVSLDRALGAEDKAKIEAGVRLEDGISKLQLVGDDSNWRVIMTEGRNRQIRRTFAGLSYRVIKLHRTQFGGYKLEALGSGAWRQTKPTESL